MPMTDRIVAGFISIHALLAESDDNYIYNVSIGGVFLSTLSLRRATRFLASWSAVLTISIHALLAESDYQRSGY